MDREDQTALPPKQYYGMCSTAVEWTRWLKLMETVRSPVDKVCPLLKGQLC